ncbi:thiolase domain-containing protein [Parvularcula sp. ZS-1/3]|uniref:Thiolase domain-containing protein n=1 Tax=Parvularcula mediterranea TaxID=2732508 RepID=A0A7Y3RM61_9PROT|nr:acetyl-CoA acetyltransferase [Parvularcula mediterranea]NNU16648.1 thiolase domain-containing protein [Parvularcula mediterranea]
MSKAIYILGGYQSDFARNYTREDLSIFDLFAEGVRGGLENASLGPKDVEVAHVGNFVGELFTGQGMLGGFMGHVHPDLAGVPASRHEGACASGSLAALAAMADLESGRYDLACVAGIELMRNVPGKDAADHLGAAIWVGEEAEDATFIWPAMFSGLAEEVDRRHGLNHDHLAEIAQINFANAKRNGRAQTRGWTLTDEHFSDNEELNPVVEGWMRRHDCSQITDGTAVVFLASEERARAHAKKLGKPLESFARIKGWGHTTAPMLMDTKLTASQGQDYLLPWTRKAITDAYGRAGVSGAEEIDAIETHDCFTINEYIAIEHFGITAPGEAWKAVEDGRIAHGGSIPVNPSGGLMGIGHPVGATGVRMLLDASHQVTGQAGDMQVEGARNIATFNVGGSGTTNCSFVVGVDA